MNEGLCSRRLPAVRQDLPIAKILLCPLRRNVRRENPPLTPPLVKGEEKGDLKEL